MSPLVQVVQDRDQIVLRDADLILARVAMYPSNRTIPRSLKGDFALILESQELGKLAADPMLSTKMLDHSELIDFKTEVIPIPLCGSGILKIQPSGIDRSLLRLCPFVKEPVRMIEG